MIQADRQVPIAFGRAMVKVHQEAGCEVGIEDRIERVLQRSKRCGMQRDVDLGAADVDVAMS
jgi:hypothetical protein